MADQISPHLKAAFPHLEESLTWLEDSGTDFQGVAAAHESLVEQGSGGFRHLSEMASHLTATESFHEEEEIEHPVEPEAHGLMQGFISAEPDLETVVHHPDPEWTEETIARRGISLRVGSVALLLLAILLAVNLPEPWVEWFKGKSDWTRNVAFAQTWLRGWTVMALVVAGIGSYQRRRWSVPLIHASGWLAAISVLMSLAVASGGFFFLVPHDTPADKAALVGIGPMLLKLGIYGVLAPLLLIAIYQRRHLMLVCERRDPQSRWTDGLPEPLLMVWLCGVGGAIALGSLLFLNGAFPLAGTLVSGAIGKCCLLAGMGVFALSAWLVAKQQKAGWSLLWLASVLLLGSAVWVLLVTPWNQVLEALGRPADSSASLEPSRMAALLAGSIFAPLSMVLLMSRNSFPEEDKASVEH